MICPEKVLLCLFERFAGFHQPLNVQLSSSDELVNDPRRKLGFLNLAISSAASLPGFPEAWTISLRVETTCRVGTYRAGRARCQGRVRVRSKLPIFPIAPCFQDLFQLPGTNFTSSRSKKRITRRCPHRLLNPQNPQESSLGVEEKVTNPSLG